MTGRVPPAMWVAIVALGFITLMTLFLAVAKGSLLHLITAALDAALLLGLADGRKWASTYLPCGLLGSRRYACQCVAASTIAR